MIPNPDIIELQHAVEGLSERYDRMAANLERVTSALGRLTEIAAQTTETLELMQLRVKQVEARGHHPRRG